MSQTVVVTHADGEPGATIARLLEDAGCSVWSAIRPGLDALVNVYHLDPGGCGPIEDLSASSFARVVDANVTEAVFAAQRAALQMIADGRRGCIVNVTSVAGVVAVPGQAAFCAGAAAMTALTKVLASEWAGYGIRVAAVGAGLSSELVSGLRALPGAAHRVPPGALVSANSVAEVVRFVLSDAAASIAGVPVYVDGGWLADGYWEAPPA